MRDNVLTRKKAGLILMLAKAFKVTPEKALGVFYSTNVNRMLSDRRFGLQLMCNRSLARDVMVELRECNGMKSRNRGIEKSNNARSAAFRKTRLVVAAIDGGAKANERK